jgi:preprotein translocase subunit SecB
MSALPPEPDLSPCQLVDARVARVQFELNPDFGFDFDGLTYRIEPVSEAHVSEDVLTASLRLEIHWEAQPGKAHPFDLSLDIVGLFEWIGSTRDPERMEGWLNFNGPYLLWPYARAHITALTALAGMPPLTITTYAVPKMHRSPVEAPQGNTPFG